MFTRRYLLAVAIAGVLCISMPAYADIVFMLGNNPQPSEQNILFKTDQTGTTVTGFTNGTNNQVFFSSSTDTLVVTAAGQAVISAQDGLLNNLTIDTAEGITFLDFILNPQIPSGSHGTFDATVAVVSGPDTFTYSYSGGLENGQNFLTIYATGGEVIDSLNISSSSGFDSLKQPRISGVCDTTGCETTAIPEPSSLTLLGTTLVGLVAVIRRLRR